MSEARFIRGLGRGQCYIVQQGEEYVVQDRFNFTDKKEIRFDHLLNAILYAQEHFGVINFRQPLTFKEPSHA